MKYLGNWYKEKKQFHAHKDGKAGGQKTGQKEDGMGKDKKPYRKQEKQVIFSPLV